jgi:hypothetical protein
LGKVAVHKVDNIEFSRFARKHPSFGSLSDILGRYHSRTATRGAVPLDRFSLYCARHFRGLANRVLRDESRVQEQSLHNSHARSHGAPPRPFQKQIHELAHPFQRAFHPGRSIKVLLCFYDWWADVCETKPLSQRGWAVQERLLGLRTIHFATPVFWECRELIACETYPNGLGRHRMAAIDKIWSTMRTNREDSRKWNNVVDTFSGCALTRSEDKLVAISGVAKALQPIFQDNYLAGLWRKHLLPGLLCTVDKDVDGKDKDVVRSSPYRGRTSII